MKKWKICRKEPVMKMMVEYHDAGRSYSRDMFDHLKFICMKLFQDLIIPGYVER